jgi:TPP-dependent pyruvate/acetoin dehydrogenase alpha subunit
MDNISDLKLYESMLRIRMIEESIANQYSEGKMRCPTHLSIGQEAISVGVCSNLSQNDMVLSTHRAHAHYLAKGGDLKRMIAEIYGKRTGCSKGMGGSMHLIDKSAGFMGSTAIVANTIPVAVGLGLSLKLKNSDSISCVFFGDGAIEEGVFYESVNFAVVKNLPVLFVCENNLYSVYSNLEVRQPKGRKIHKMVNAMGIDSHHDDGNDVIKVFKKVSKLKDKIRSGYGPQFIELDTYRWREHCGPNYDNDIGYRLESEFQKWKKRDPLTKFNKMISSDEYSKVVSKITNEISNAHNFAEKSEFPDYDDFYQAFNSNLS